MTITRRNPAGSLSEEHKEQYKSSSGMNGLLDAGSGRLNSADCAINGYVRSNAKNLKVTPSMFSKLNPRYLFESSQECKEPLPHEVDRLRRIGVSGVEPPASLKYKVVNGRRVERKVVGINGFWYDVTNFISSHPGGPIIDKYIGKDATDVFNAFRHIDITRMRKPVGQYERPVKHPADKDFQKLIKFFEAEGYFKTSVSFYIIKVLFAWTLFFTGWTCVLAFDHYLVHYLGAVFMAFSWHQFGFIQHECGHVQVTRNWFIDRMLSMWLGSIPIGFSAHWWQDEHILHHALTNVVDVDKRWADPQMWETSWAQDARLFPMFQNAISWVFIKIQHITFIPFVVGIGRFEIVQDSTRVEKRWYEDVSLAIHWLWMIWLLSHLSTWNEIFVWYMIASVVEGIFHFQLILSHYCREFLDLSEYHESSWYTFMVTSDLNIDCPWWLDWFYGGLQFHIEHHLFPKMARNKLRSAAPYVQEICKRHKIEYVSLPFSTALWITLKHLKRVGKHFTLDPR